MLRRRQLSHCDEPIVRSHQRREGREQISESDACFQPARRTDVARWRKRLDLVHEPSVIVEFEPELAAKTRPELAAKTLPDRCLSWRIASGGQPRQIYRRLNRGNRAEDDSNAGELPHSPQAAAADAARARARPALDSDWTCGDCGQRRRGDDRRPAGGRTAEVQERP